MTPQAFGRRVPSGLIIWSRPLSELHTAAALCLRGATERRNVSAIVFCEWVVKGLAACSSCLIADDACHVCYSHGDSVVPRSRIAYCMFVSSPRGSFAEDGTLL